jgi:hypothetical protein
VQQAGQNCAYWSAGWLGVDPETSQRVQRLGTAHLLPALAENCVQGCRAISRGMKKSMVIAITKVIR